jgi:hypothetical protein
MNYARQPIARTAAGFTITNQVVSLTALVQFPLVAVGSGSASFWSLNTLPTGAGQIVAYGPLSVSIPIQPGAIPQLNAGTSAFVLGASINAGLLGDLFDAPAYNNSVVYSQGQFVTSGGVIYIFINPTISSGHAPPNTTYWLPVTLTDQGLGNTTSTDILNLIFNALAWPGMAENASSSPFTNLYAALHTASPTAAGPGTNNELSYT